MRITVNGKATEVSDGITIDTLLTEFGVRRDYIAVAVNQEVVPRDSHATTVLRAGDRVEIVHPMQGG